MPFPKRFKSLLETETKDVTSPSHVWVTYAVCGVETDSCGWGGWMLEAAISDRNGDRDVLSSDSEQVCPRCGKPTFRTAATLRFDLSPNQEDPFPGAGSKSLPMEYE